jgi:hypothetical protein
LPGHCHRYKHLLGHFFHPFPRPAAAELGEEEGTWESLTKPAEESRYEDAIVVYNYASWLITGYGIERRDAKRCFGVRGTWEI